MRPLPLGMLLFFPRVLLAQVAAQADPPAAAKALAVPGWQWIHRANAGADIYVRAGSRAELHLRSLSDSVDRAIRGNLTWLGESPSRKRLRLFFVGARDEMRPLVGSTPGGWSVTDEGTAFFVANDSIRPALRHEIMHLLSWQRWGTPAGIWLSEGIATLAVGRCRGFTPDAIAAALHRDGQLPALRDLREHFVFEGEAGARMYLTSASLAGYIDRTYGRTRLRDFWRGGGFGGSLRTLGDSTEIIEGGWRAMLAQQPAGERWSRMWEMIRARGCE